MNDVSVAALPQDMPVRFAGRPGFIRLLLKNALLSIVTLGFYRFWARTAARRALWNNVVIAGEPLEYTGRGVELFIGFLIALAIIAPMAAIYGLIQYLMFVSPEVAGAAQIAYFAVLGVLIQVAIFRARRYRLSRTQWRGIRCWQDGSTGRYVGLSLLYGLLSFVTLGLAMPWMNTALQRYKIEHTIFGDRRFSFTGRGRDLFSQWLAVYVAGATPLAVFAIINADVGMAIFAVVMESGFEDQQALAPLFQRISFTWLLPFIYVGGAIAYLWYRVAEFRYFAAHTHFGAAGLVSVARLWRIVLIFLGFIGATLGLLFVGLSAGALIGLATSALASANGWDVQTFVSSNLFVVEIIFMVVLFLFVNYILAQYFMTYRIARHLVSTLTITNFAVVESVLQSTQARPRYGEGLADAFDLGAV